MQKVETCVKAVANAEFYVWSTNQIQLIMKTTITLFAYALSITTLLGQWVTDNMSTGRQTLTSASFQGKIYLISGTNVANSIAYNTVDVINPLTTTLDTTLVMPKGLGYAQAVAGDSALYVAGGFEPSVNDAFVGTKYFQVYKNGIWTLDYLWLLRL